MSIRVSVPTLRARLRRRNCLVVSVDLNVQTSTKHQRLPVTLLHGGGVNPITEIGLQSTLILGVILFLLCVRVRLTFDAPSVPQSPQKRTPVRVQGQKEDEVLHVANRRVSGDLQYHGIR